MNLKKDYWRDLNHEEALIVKYDLSVIRRREAVVKMITRKRGRLLDLGCGIEFFLYDGLDNFEKVGVDLALSSFNQMRHNKLISGDGLFVNADARALPFKDNTFDAVISSNAFDHFPEPAACAKEISRVLKPGGEFIVCTPRALAGGLKVHGHIVDIYTPEKMNEIFKDYFSTDKIAYIHNFYGLFWENILFVLNIFYSACYKMTFSKKRRKNLYDTKLYAGFARIFKNAFDSADILFSRFSFLKTGYLLARFLKK